MSDTAKSTGAGALDSDPDRRSAGMRVLRAQGGVVPFPETEGVLAAVRYDTVDAGLRSVEDFGSSAGQDAVPDVDKHIAAITEPRHSKIRRIINSVVAFHKSQQIEPYLQQLVDSLLDAMLEEARTAGPDGVDVVVHLAKPIPPAAMARLMGFPEADARKFYEWMREGGSRYQEAARRGTSITLSEANPTLTAYVDERIAERLAMPQGEWPQDALTRFLVTEVEGERLEPRNIRAQILFMIGAGSDTTKNLIGSLIYRLGRDPEVYAALRADPSLIDAAIEEGLRLDAPAQFMVRTCQRPTELGDTKIEAGQRVFMCIGSANHDDDVFDHPDEFRLDRENRDHLSFGAGSHICAGMALARLEVRTLMHAFIERIVTFHLVDPDNYHPIESAMLQGPSTVRIVIDELAR